MRHPQALPNHLKSRCSLLVLQDDLAQLYTYSLTSEYTNCSSDNIQHAKTDAHFQDGIEWNRSLDLRFTPHLPPQTGMCKLYSDTSHVVWLAM